MTDRLLELSKKMNKIFEANEKLCLMNKIIFKKHEILREKSNSEIDTMKKLHLTYAFEDFTKLVYKLQTINGVK